MVADTVVVSVVTAFFAVIGILLPFIVGRGENKGWVKWLSEFLMYYTNWLIDTQFGKSVWLVS